MQRPFPRMTYADAMSKYGSDKPDTRFGLELQSLPEVAASAIGIVVSSSRPWSSKETERLCDRFGVDRTLHSVSTIRVLEDGKYRSSATLASPFSAVSGGLSRIGARCET